MPLLNTAIAKAHGWHCPILGVVNALPEARPARSTSGHRKVLAAHSALA